MAVAQLLHEGLAGLAALAAVLGLIWGLTWAGRRLARLGGGRLPAAAGRLRRCQSLALDQRRRLHLIECDGRPVLLLTGGPQDVVVGWTGGDAQP